MGLTSFMKDVLFIMTKNLSKLLEKDKFVSTNNQNLQVLATEMYKVTKGLSSKIFANTIWPRNQPNWNKMPLANSVYNGPESIVFLGPKAWGLVPEEIKQKESLNAFKDAMKKWSPTNYPCSSCKDFLHGVGLQP